MIVPGEVQVPGEVMPAEAPPMKKLDLGCGQNRADQFLGVDIVAMEGVDVVWDLTKAPWPFEDDSIDEARTSHFFEHLGPEERILFMNELHRVLKKGAGCLFTTPRGFDRQVQDFSHRWPPVVEASYFYFDQNWLRENKLDHYIDLHGIKCNFEIRPVHVSVTPDFAMRNDEHKIFATRNYTNVAVDLTVLVVKR